MCNPFAIAAVVAGSAMQANAQHQRQKNMQNAADDAREAELFRQEGLSKEREQALDPAMQNANRATQDAALEDAAAKRQAAYSGDTTLPGDAGTAGYQAPSAGATYGQPKIVQEETDKQRAKGDADVRSIGDARARLASYGDVGLGNQILNQNAGNNINMLGGFSRMSSALLPGEVQNAMAKHAGDRKNEELLGSALVMAGSVGGGMGAGASGAGSYGTAMGGSANAGATIGGYAGDLSSFTPMAGAAGTAAADAAAPSLWGGLLANGKGMFMPAAQSRYGTAAAGGIGSLLARR